jgi:hypothetical protein
MENVLVCRRVTYFSFKDEDAFFSWIKKIGCIEKTSGAGDELYLHIVSREIHDCHLRDLLALFHRYKIPMKQLKRFLTEENKDWFYENKEAFWHVAVFGNKRDR